MKIVSVLSKDNSLVNNSTQANAAIQTQAKQNTLTNWELDENMWGA